MLKLTSIIKQNCECYDTLTLPFELRQKARLHANLDNGEEVGLFLPRGNILRDGDILKAESGEYIKIIAANESVHTATSEDSVVLSRACYHLGNRHLPLQITQHWIRFGEDHVLAEMVANLGMHVALEQAPFEPESGAYAQQPGHSHSHEH
jgi:urease accessory protein